MLVKTHQLLREHENRAWEQVKRREDQVRGRHEYQPGDEVLLYWVQFRAFNEGHKKHHPRYVGPYTVKRVVQPDVLELDGLPGRMPSHINIQYIYPYRRDVDPHFMGLRQAEHPTPTEEVGVAHTSQGRRQGGQSVVSTP